MFKNFESERISPTVKLSNSESPSKISRKSPCIMLFEKACSCCLKSLIWAPNTAFVFAQCSAQGHLSACPATNFLFLCRGAGGGDKTGSSPEGGRGSPPTTAVITARASIALSSWTARARPTGCHHYDLESRGNDTIFPKNLDLLFNKLNFLECQRSAAELEKFTGRNVKDREKVLSPICSSLPQTKQQQG